MASKGKSNATFLIAIVSIACVVMFVILATVIYMVLTQDDRSSSTEDIEISSPTYGNDEGQPRNMNARPSNRAPLNEEDPSGVNFKEHLKTLIPSEANINHFSLRQNVSDYVESIETDYVIAKYYAEELALLYANDALFKNVKTLEDYAYLYFKIDYVFLDAVYGGSDAIYADFALAMWPYVKTMQKENRVEDSIVETLNQATVKVLDQYKY